MHPNLAVHNHPSCAGAIQALQDCHEANKFMRFLGACNQLKNELDACLTEEVSTVRVGWCRPYSTVVLMLSLAYTRARLRSRVWHFSMYWRFVKEMHVPMRV